MNTATITSQFVVGGISFSGAITKQAEGQIAQDVPLLKGIAGAIDASGVDGLEAGHGIIATDVIDVHWDDPTDGTHKVRRGLVVDTANANDIDFDETPAGEGDALPASSTAVVVSVQVVIDTVFSGDLLALIGVTMTQKGVLDFRSSGASELPLKMSAGGVWSWATGQGFANPMAGDSLIEIIASNGSIVASTAKVGILYESVSGA